MRAIYNTIESIPFNCYFSGTIGELKEFITKGIYHKDEYDNEAVV